MAGLLFVWQSRCHPACLARLAAMRTGMVTLTEELPTCATEPSTQCFCAETTADASRLWRSRRHDAAAQPVRQPAADAARTGRPHAVHAGSAAPRERSARS